MKTLRTLVTLLIAAAASAALPAASPLAGSGWIRTWAAAPLEMPPARPGEARTPLRDVTFRTIVRVSAGGTALRLRLSNELSATPLPIGSVHVALADATNRIVPGSDHAVTFDGDARVTIPPYAPLVSDVVKMTVPALQHVVVSIFVSGDASEATVHQLALSPSIIAPGDQTGAVELGGGRASTMRYVLTGIDVPASPRSGTVVTIGDSITDGAKSTSGADHRWPDFLAERLAAAGRRDIGIANVGISGNRLLKTGAGPAMLARIDRDIVSIPGVRYVILLEGINDIGSAARDKADLPTADDLIDAYRQLIARAHDHGVKVILATLTPYKGAGYYSPEGDAIRRQVNYWIRTSRAADGVIDFDRATRDPADPLKFAAANDSGDFLHPGDEGYRAMAAAVDLRLFQ